MKKLLTKFSIFNFQLSTPQGFTLIELLVVIAILSILAAVVIVVINPLEQFARTRDAGRKTTISQMQAAVQGYYASHNATYPTANATWLTSLQTAGEIKSIPAAISYSVSGSSACGTNAQNGWCFNTNATDAIIFTRLESSSEKSKCAANTNPFFVWDSSLNQSCLVCAAADPTIGTACNATQ